jgi:hypothetical protein
MTNDRIKAYPENDYSTVTFVAENEITPGAVLQAGSNPGEVDEAADEASPIGVAGRETVGPNNETHKSGNAVNVIVDGVARLETSEAVNAGDRVTPAGNGQVKGHVAGTDAENIVVGRVLEGTGGSGEYAEVMVNL